MMNSYDKELIRRNADDLTKALNQGDYAYIGTSEDWFPDEAVLSEVELRRYAEDMFEQGKRDPEYQFETAAEVHDDMLNHVFTVDHIDLEEALGEDK